MRVSLSPGMSGMEAKNLLNTRAISVWLVRDGHFLEFSLCPFPNRIFIHNTHAQWTCLLHCTRRPNTIPTKSITLNQVNRSGIHAVFTSMKHSVQVMAC